MRVLVAYGSKMGGTEGIARRIAEVLRARGIDVEVKSGRDVRNIDDFGSVVVGGGLYANRWQKHARRFVRRNTSALRDRPVWFFSSGPLDDSATETEIPPTKQVRKLMDRVGAEGHMTFGGRLEADVKGFPAGAMAKENAGDWRDAEHIRGWAEKIAADLH